MSVRYNPPLLWQSFQDCVGLLRHGHQAELKLGSCLNHSWRGNNISVSSALTASPPLTCSLVPDVLQRGGNINLLGSLGHPVEDHVYQDVGPRPPHSVTAVHDHRATPASVALVNFPTDRENNISHRFAARIKNILEISYPASGSLILNMLLLLSGGGWWR